MRLHYTSAGNIPVSRVSNGKGLGKGGPKGSKFEENIHIMHFLKSLRRWIQCQCQSQLYINGQYDIRLVDRKEIVFYCVQRQAAFSLGVMTIGGESDEGKSYFTTGSSQHLTPTNR